MAHRPYRSEHDGYRDIVKDFSSRYRYSAYEGDLPGENYEDDYTSGSLTDEEYEDDNSYEPVWANAVSDSGDLFYIEPGDPRTTEPPQSILVNQNSVNNEQNDQSNGQKQKKGLLKKKVKKFIRPDKEEQDKETNNNAKNAKLRTRNSYSKSCVTFNDMPTGVLKEVTLFVDPTRHNFGRRATLCESLFGIVPGQFNSRSNYASTDKRIMVQGLLPGHEAMRSGNVKIGDWLMCVNDLEINLDNIDSILSAITGPREVKLTLQKLAVQQLHTPQKKTSPVNEQLIRIVSGQGVSETVLSLDGFIYGVLYLKSDSICDDNQEDTLYQFPEDRSKLVDVRGMFITLAHVMMEVTDNITNNSTLLMDDKLVHVSYAREGQEVFIVAMPAKRVSLAQLNKLTEDLVRIVKVLYGSLHSAFSNKLNHNALDHFFQLTFRRVLLADDLERLAGRSVDNREPFLDFVPGVRALALPEEVKVSISACLGEFEAADFADMSDDYYDMRRSYVILGTCLFYKGYLVANHLPREDLEDIYLYLNTHCLLSLSHDQHMGQLVVWREVFPWRRCHSHSTPLLPGYTEMEARWFLLVVGMKTNMMAVLLEAGGCASWIESSPGPDPFYVDQAKATLLQLASHDVSNHCEARLQTEPIPSLATVDWFFPQQMKNKDDANKTPMANKPGIPQSKKLLQPESILKKRNGPGSQSGTQGRGAVYDVESDVDSLSTGNSDSSTPVMGRKGDSKVSLGSDESGSSSGNVNPFKGSRKNRNMLSAYDLSGLKRSLSDLPGEAGSSVKLTAGCDNTLFHYVHLDDLDGILICPSRQELGQVMTPTHNKVIANFHQACISIRKILQPPEITKVGNIMHQKGRLSSASSLGDITEHGILFECTPENWTVGKKALPVVTYWVVGRLIGGPCPREFYVCFEDSAEQNVIELAFKLGFGLTV